MEDVTFLYAGWTYLGVEPYRWYVTRCQTFGTSQEISGLQSVCLYGTGRRTHGVHMMHITFFGLKIRDVRIFDPLYTTI